MDRIAKDALKASIEHWKNVVLGEDVSDGWRNCALCKEFIKNKCADCPVKEYTRLEYCYGTPYHNFQELDGIGKDVYSGELLELAREEYDFLKSLLPDEKTRSHKTPSKIKKA